MSAQQCSPDCSKVIERQKIYERKSARKECLKNKIFETDDDIAASTLISKSSQANFSTDFSEISNETEYLSVPVGDDSSKDAQEHLEKHVDSIDKMEKSHQKYQEESHRRPQTPRAKRISIDNVESTDVDELTSRDASSSPDPSSRQETKSDEAKKRNRSCQNEECSDKPKRKRKRKRSVSYVSEISSSTDPSCPVLCELDEVKLPEPLQRCDSSCPSQILADKQREMMQAEVDRYMLYGGFRYFDDLCHCSLKCILIQVLGDKFVQKTASSAFFFAMGMKLCYELNAWHIKF